MNKRWSLGQIIDLVKRGMVEHKTGQVMKLINHSEPELELYWAYRKRIKVAPDEVKENAQLRMIELVGDEGLAKEVYEHVCEAIWQDLSVEQRRYWMLQVK